jgi:type IV pilus assembly protein PilC
MFSSRLPLKSLIELCRVLRHYLGAGLTLPDVFRQQAKRGPAPVRDMAARVADALEQGDALEDALKREAKMFPPLFLSLGSVGERTGMLPEVFADLEKYFLRQKQLRERFLAQIAWPAIQFFLAVFVLAFLIWVLGMLGSKDLQGKPYDPLGFGLLGTSGALTFLGIVFGTLGGLFGLYFLASRGLGGRSGSARFLLGLPAIGPCLQALALGRFCLALRLTTESAMSINKALRLSMQATGNLAFAEASPLAEEAVKRGDDLAVAIQRTGLMPADFVHIMEVAEESGNLHDVMRHQADHYYEEASRRMAVLTAIAGYGVWGMVALFIIIAIFRIYGSYIGMIDQLTT